MLSDQAYAVAELERMVANIVRSGTIYSISHSKARARVRFDENLLSDDLPWIAMAGENKAWRPPSVGEQVVVLSPSGELATGIILAGLYQQSMPAPSASGDDNRIVFADGSQVSWRPNNLTIAAKGDLTIRAAGKLTIGAEGGVSFQTNGAVDLRGDTTRIEATEGVSIRGRTITANKRISQP